MKKIFYFLGVFGSVITIIGAFVILILDQLNENGIINAMISIESMTKNILLLLSFFSSTILILMNSKFENLEKSIDMKYGQIIDNLGGVNVTRFCLVDEGFIYWTRRINESEKEIQHAAFAPPIAVLSKKRDQYEKTIEKKLKQNHVRYRYIARLGEIAEDNSRMRRLDYIKKLLEDKEVKKYLPAYFEFDPKIGEDPSPSFMILDHEEVIAYYPKIFGEEEVILSIKHPQILKMYEDYFLYLYSQAKKLTLSEALKLERRFS